MQSPLHHQFAIACLQLELNEKPSKARELAINYYEDYLVLSEEFKALSLAYKKLLKKHKQTHEENEAMRDYIKANLAEKKPLHKPRIPSFLPAKKH